MCVCSNECVCVCERFIVGVNDFGAFEYMCENVVYILLYIYINYMILVMLMADSHNQTHHAHNHTHHYLSVILSFYTLQR